MELEEILMSEIRERRHVDAGEIGAVLCPYLRANKYKVYLWGLYDDIEILIIFLKYCGIEVCGVVEENPTIEKLLGRIEVLSPKAFFEKHNREADEANVFTIVTYPTHRKIEILKKIHRSNCGKLNALQDLRNNKSRRAEAIKALSKHGIEYATVLRSDLDDINGYTYEDFDGGRIRYYRENADALKKLYDMFADEQSKKTLVEYVRCYMQSGVYSLEQCDSRVKYYYGHDREDGNFEELYKHTDEVFLNCGSSIGDTISLFFDNGLKAKKIYAYEGDRNEYCKLVNNLRFLSPKDREVVQPINLMINVETEFEKYITEPVTLINADIEGYELPMLKAMEQIIKKDRPVIAICVYHKKEDLIEIPKYLNEITENYCFKLRKYEAETANVARTAELVLYAIPTERN